MTGYAVDKVTVDAVGGIVIPKRIRDRLGIQSGAEVEVADGS